MKDVHVKDVHVVAAVRAPVVGHGGSPATVRPDRPAARTVRAPLALEP